MDKVSIPYVRVSLFDCNLQCNMFCCLVDDLNGLSSWFKYHTAFCLDTHTATSEDMVYACSSRRESLATFELVT